MFGLAWVWFGMALGFVWFGLGWFGSGVGLVALLADLFGIQPWP